MRTWKVECEAYNALQCISSKSRESLGSLLEVSLYTQAKGNRGGALLVMMWSNLDLVVAFACTGFRVSICGAATA